MPFILVSPRMRITFLLILSLFCVTLVGWCPSNSSKAVELINVFAFSNVGICLKIVFPLQNELCGALWNTFSLHFYNLYVILDEKESKKRLLLSQILKKITECQNIKLSSVSIQKIN